jgi:hypothetical protein
LPVTFETIGIVAPVVYVTLDGASITAVTLSGGGLVATNTGTTSTDQGAKVASASGKATGKYYFELTWTAITGGANSGIGVGTFASTYTGMGNGGVVGAIGYKGGGSIYSNGANSGILIDTVFLAGSTMCAAIDLDSRKIWFRRAPAGNWNNNVANNPATSVGGVAIPAGTLVPFVTFGGTGGLANNVSTVNFGASAFLGAVPSGFTSGWPT